MNPTRILIIEDDVTLSGQLAGLLRSQGFIIDQQYDGEQGLFAALNTTFDLILLDVLLPAMSGFSLLNKIRKVKQTPIMMMSACGAEEDRIEGYSNGADDYLPKPFSFKEVSVRISALLRRVRNNVDDVHKQNTLLSGKLSLNRTERQAYYAEKDMMLTPIQFRLLWLLVESQHEPLSKPYLYQAVLERSYSRYDRSLDMHLSRVRKKLVDAGMPADRLITVHGVGYLYS